MFPVKHVKLRAWYDHGRSRESFSRSEMAARKMSATDFDIETPSKRSQLAQVFSTSLGTTPTSVAGQIQRKYRRMQVQHCHSRQHFSVCFGVSFQLSS